MATGWAGGRRVAAMPRTTPTATTATITAAIIDLGHRLGLQVLAEGVETEEQRALLNHLGCDGIQGYLISRPLPAAEAAARFLTAVAGDRADG